MQPVVARVGDNLIKIFRNGANIFIDTPFVVIEDADEFLGRVRNIVQRLKEMPLVSAASPNTHHIFIRLPLIARRAHAQRRGQSRACMPAPNEIMSLSVRNAKPLRPPVCRIFLNFS